VPRTDLQVTVDGVSIKPAFALGGWLAFKPMGAGAMVMGDLVLTGNEINPVMTKLLAGGVGVTAVHNHLLRAQPPTFYMHVNGEGDPVKLATTLHDALTASKTPFAAPPAVASSTPAAPELDSAKLEQVLGYKATLNGGVYQFSVPRRHDERCRHGHAASHGHGNPVTSSRRATARQRSPGLIPCYDAGHLDSRRLRAGSG
jgi:hypothetical protein